MKKIRNKKKKLATEKITKLKLIDRRSKLTEKDIQYMVKLQKKNNIKYGGRKITILINKKYKEEERNLTISRMNTCRILNKHIGKPRKIRKVFSVTKKKNKE